MLLRQRLFQFRFNCCDLRSDRQNIGVKIRLVFQGHLTLMLQRRNGLAVGTNIGVFRDSGRAKKIHILQALKDFNFPQLCLNLLHPHRVLFTRHHQIGQTAHGRFNLCLKINDFLPFLGARNSSQCLLKFFLNYAQT